MAVAVVVGCTVLLLGGVSVVVLWGSQRIREPLDETSLDVQLEIVHTRAERTEARTEAKLRAFRRYFWWADVVSFSALVSAVLAAWPGGRLAMRVLALTSPDAAQGRLTEADFIVGFPTIEGSLALLLFAGLPAGYCAALLYVVLRRWLPPGRWAGPLLGVLILVWLGALVDPLRADNIDFDIVEPGWLAVALFGGLAVLHGAVVAAAAGWWSERVPLWGGKSFKNYLPLFLGCVAFPPAGLAVGIGAILLLIWMSVIPVSRLRSNRQSRVPAWVGAGAVVLASAAALPVFVGAVISITSRAG
ncbi:hypothetical protein [Arthrobacter sp. PAMC25284]|uniref:hypothetical protein n=1 Tax=Arthrobacter sp. PAMC25284 TaxID=2861279 RepID=UPI001C63AA88|nr:hypothetical protein [Arthrobacter sp. PAMC25284]QYF90689.1 hypothetical protein KY499_05305 [Arthrobacter sp. PAMC25284]